MTADRFHAIRHALRHGRVLAADGWYTPADSDRIAPTDREFISACDPVTVGTLLVERDDLLTDLHGVGLALGISVDERSPMSLTFGALELRNELGRLRTATFPEWLTAALCHQGAASLQRLCNDAGHQVDYSVVAAWLESIGWCEADITARAKDLVKTDDGSEAW